VSNAAGQAAGQANEAAAQAADGAGSSGEDQAEPDGAESANGEGWTTRATVDELGDIIETTFDENGEVVGEELGGNVGDLEAEEEYVDDEGRVVGRVRDESGNAFERVIDAEGNVVGARSV
jgi:hypothetical protein